MTQQLIPFRPPRPNLLIEAGAGTGKTTEIVKEVIHLLLEHPDLDPERLVLITFTEKAAAEIGERIRDAMTDLYTSFDPGPARWPSDWETPIITVPESKAARYRAACQKHLERLDRIRSQTIHAFCQGVLKSLPIEAGIDAGFIVLEGYERSSLLQIAWTGWLEHETVTRPTEEWLEDWETALEHFAGLDRVQESIFEMVDKRVLITDDRYPLGDFADGARIIRDSVAAVRQLRAAEIESVTDPAGLAVLRHLRAAEPPLADSIPEWRRYFEPVAEPLRNVDLRDVPKHLRDSIRCLREENGFRSVYDLLGSHEAAVALRRLARRFLTWLDEAKRREGLADFDDLLLRTAELLEDDRAAAAVRARFDYIFVDEFQDTDRVQARIVDRLARNPSGELVHGRVVLVGDPKQSIYAFRHADPETYRDTLATFAAAGAQQRTLTRQFRSEPALVESLNVMFTQLFARPGDPNVYRPVYHQLDPAREPRGAVGPHILFLRAGSVTGDSESQSAAREGQAVASYIRDELGRGRRYRDFAILLRKSVNVQAILDGLDRLDIPYVLPPIGALLETRPIVDLLSVLRAIAAPYDLGAVISAARAPYFGLDDDEIVSGVLAEREKEGETGRQGDGEKEQDSSHPLPLSPSPRPFIAFKETLGNYREMARRLPVAELIDRLLHDAEMELLYGVLRGRSEWLRFVERFRQIAAEFDLAGRGSLGQFVDEQLRRREGAEETQPTPIDDGRDAVRVMTVHGSKGLEFPIVILPELSAQTREDTLSVFTIENPPRLVFTGTVSTLGSRYLSLGNDQVPAEVGGERRSAETDRLFYVAVTRAQDKVVFVWSPLKWVKKSFFKRLSNIFGWEKGFQPFGEQPGMIETVAAAGDRAVPVGHITPRMDGEIEMAPSRFLDRAIENAVSLFPRLPNETPVKPEEAPLTRAEIMQRAAAAANRGTGILLHRTLELWDGDAATLDALLAQLEREQGADSRTLELTRKRLVNLSRSASFQRVMKSALRGRELTIYHGGEDGSAVESRIDRLIEDEAGNLVVVDFKSGVDSASRSEADRQQVQQYCAALGRLSGKSCRGLLWYIDIDSDQLIDVV